VPYRVTYVSTVDLLACNIMSRLEFARIPALTFYKDATTTYRRTSPLPQLVCLGKPCKLYTPDVVRCESLGGVGTEIDWKCEADLPESLRFGKVEVSCEGWSAPGDPYILKGSCSLEYRLVQIPSVLRDAESHIFRPQSFFTVPEIDVPKLIIMILWIGFLLILAWSFFKSCFRGNNSRQPPRPPGPRSSNSGWFPGGYDDNSGTGPPPPYSKSAPEPGAQPWRPGFWTGAALGGLGAHLLNRRQPANPEPRAVPWDWEREPNRRAPIFGGRRMPSGSEDRGEGSSDLGGMRRSTGLGGSRVR